MRYPVENDVLQLSHLAEEARAMADNMPDPAAKRTLIGVAEAYDAMVKRAEKSTIARWSED